MSLQDSNLWALPGLFQSSYPLSTQIILIIITLYLAAFTTLNNFYVFKPKIMKITTICRPSPEHKFTYMLYQTAICLITSLTMISFSFCSSILSSSPNNLEVFVISDGVWMGVCCAIIAYRNKDIKHDQINIKFAIKNSLMLLLIYGCILIHIQLNLYFFHFPLVLFVLFLLNQIMTAYFDKVYQIILILLSNSAEEDDMNEAKKRKPKSQFPSVETLANHHAPTQHQVSRLSNEFAEKRSHIILKSKAKVYEKLHEIYIRVSLAHNKFIDSEVKRVIYYFGRLNGTIPLQKHETSLFQNPVITLSQNNIESYNKISTNNEQLNPIVQEQQIVNQQPPQFLTYIFPIKMMQYSTPMSITFSILINLGLGFLLDYTLQILIKLGMGTVFCCLVSFFILPFAGNGITLLNYWGQMTTFSISRLGIMGFFLLLSCFMSLKEGQLFNITWIITPNTQWIMICQIGFTIYCSAVILFIRKQQYRILPLVFMVALGGFGYLSYMDSLYIY